MDRLRRVALGGALGVLAACSSSADDASSLSLNFTLADERAEALRVAFYVSNLTLDGVPLRYASPAEGQADAFQSAEYDAGLVVLQDDPADPLGLNASLALTGAGGRGELAFDLGLSERTNHCLRVETAPAPLNQPALSWSWLAGRRFASVSTTGGNFVHFGSLACSGEPSEDESCSVQCDQPNRVRVTVPDFDSDAEALRFDFAALFAGVEGEARCHHDAASDNCGTLYTRLRDAGALFSASPAATESP